MAPPPAKRQKRLVVLSSDDEVFVDSKNQKKKKDESKLPSPIRPRRLATLKSTKEEPTRPLPARKSTQHNKIETSTRHISAFFTLAGQSALSANRILQTEENTDIVQPVVEDAEAQDAIEDVSDNEETNEQKATQNTTRLVLDRRKDVSEPECNLASSTQGRKSRNGSQQFRLPSSQKRYGGNTVIANDVDQRPWADRFHPSNLEELAVHKKKVSDVRNWLEKVLSGRYRKRLLILRGPAGAGKTVTLKMLANAMKLDLSEWKNPVSSDYSSKEYISISASFDDFCTRSGKFNTLEMDSVPSDIQSTSSSDPNAQKAILIEDFPNTSFSTSTASDSFRSTILRYLATSTPSQSLLSAKDLSRGANITPMIMIITETRLTSTTNSSEIFTAHRLLGSEILNHPAVSIVEFNPVAPTFIGKALNLVVQKEARHSGRRRVPGSSVLAKLCEVGDVRSAIESLQFLCIRAQDGDNWGGRVAASAKRGAKALTTMTKMERESLEIVGQRESSLGLFHAVGKIVYNKRDDFALVPAEDSRKGAFVYPPDHLQEHMGGPGLEKTSVDQLIDETGTDVETFIAALHENYIMSCEGSALVDALDGCLDAFSDGDLLGTSRYARKGGWNTRCYEAASESLRRDEIAFHLVVRGLFSALPNPVKRSAYPTTLYGRPGGRGDLYKMFYPASMRLSRQIEGMEASIHQWYRRPKTAMASGDRHLLTPKESDKQCSEIKDQAPFEIPRQKRDEPFRTSLKCTKSQLVTETLPYITKIEQANPSSGYLCELEGITQFRGTNCIDSLRDEALEDESTYHPSSEAAQSVSLPATQQIRKEMDAVKLKAFIPEEDEVEKLYLSNDDIED